jgi:hypothetical protein
MEPIVLSPELALVDPELRAIGVAILVYEEQRRPAATPAPRLEPVVASYPAPVPAGAARRPATRRGLVLAAGAYLASTAARVLVLDALFVVAVGALVLALSLLG